MKFQNATDKRVRISLRHFSCGLTKFNRRRSAIVRTAYSPIIEAGFERGAFSAEDTALVARVQMLLSLQVPFHIAGIVLVRLVSALQANHALAWIALANFLIKVPLAVVLMRFLGVPGIALATSLMHLAAFAMLWWYVARRWSGYAA